MNKSLTKKALKQNLKNERLKNRTLISRVSELEAEVDSLGKKLDALGSEMDTPETDKGCMRVIKVEPKCYGIYRKSARDFSDLESEHHILVKELVEGLIKNHIVQFIEMEAETPFYPYYTTAAKLFVIPWNELALCEDLRFYKNNLKRVGDT
jgi:hypothetical protein